MAVLVVVLLAGLSPDRSEMPVSMALSGGDEDLALDNFEYRDVRDGQTRWTLTAARAEYFEGRRETVLNRVNAVFFLEDGGRVKLRGNEGILDNETSNMQISGNVHLNYQDTYRLLTDRLDYDRQRQLMHTPAPVLLEGSGLVLEGIGLHLEIERGRLSILEEVRTRVQGLCLSRGSGRETGRSQA
jgi:LPS export ABC transporter protein LptC